MKHLPALNRELLTALVELLYLIVVHQHATRMDAKNLSIVLGPNLTRRDQPMGIVPLEQFFNTLIMNKDTVLYVRKQTGSEEQQNNEKQGGGRAER